MLRLQPGTLFARDFRVVSALREGGMGAVYVVDQLSTGMRRALKIMQPALLEDGRARDRFAHEARVGGQIKSNHRVEVVGAGVDEATGMPWLAMELLEGEELAEHVRRVGPLPPAEAAEILAQAGHALAAAHAVGVVHCDLKPENLFIAVSAQRGVPFIVKVLDFGIARLFQEHRASVTVTTAVGSPLWMAPEQGARGAKIRPSTDVWALGLIAFWMLTGRYYWRAANVPEDQLNTLTLLVELASGPIDPPTQRAAEFGLTGRIPPGFDAWFLRCIDRDPAKRWPDADVAVVEFAHALGVSASPGAAPELRGVAQTKALGVGFAGTLPMPTAPVAGASTTSPRTFPGATTRPGNRRAPLIVTGIAAGLMVAGGVGVVLYTNSQRAPAEAAAPAISPSGVSVASASAPMPTTAIEPAAVPGTASQPQSEAVAARAQTVAPGAPAAAAPVAPVVPAVPAVPAVAATAAGGVCPAGMVSIPEGTFWMGSAAGEGERDEAPQHRVHLPAFCIDRTEVTVAAFRACTAAGRCPPVPTSAWWPGVGDAEATRASRFCNAPLAGRDEHPMNCVEWDTAQRFCAARGARLPTEAEWEYAARGSDARRYPWGNEAPGPMRLNACGPECAAFFARELGEHWTPMYPIEDGWPTSAPVGSFPLGASPFGVMDMAGNVWEWTGDWYGPYLESNAQPQESPSGYAMGTHRIHRGGSRSTSTMVGVRAANRDGSDPRRRDASIGFRCVQGPAPRPPQPGMGFAVASSATGGTAAGHAPPVPDFGTHRSRSASHYGDDFGAHRPAVIAPGGGGFGDHRPAVAPPPGGGFGDHRPAAPPGGDFGNHRGQMDL